VRQILGVLVLLCTTATSVAHYNMLLPDKAWAQKGEKVTFTYQFGHPFEHELFDAPKPASLLVLLPSGKHAVLDVEKTLRKIERPGADGKRVTCWQFDYTPAERGDHVFVLKTPTIKHGEDHAVEDLVKVVLHVQTQNGWDHGLKGLPREIGVDLDLVPLTRPYGLYAGMAFSARVERYPYQPIGPPMSPTSGLRVEVEQYNEKTPKALPPDELVTFHTKTGGDGSFVATLPASGWWGITAIEGESARRVTLWVHVNEKK
jgi:cobalt/nickel transport protein